jgi:general secretion pathway protein G
MKPSHSNLARAFRRVTGGFTLIEILIVVVILGILAAIVVPHFSNASHQARENTLRDDLRFLRVQVQVYKAQHNDDPPGYPGGDRTAVPTEAEFIGQMTQFTDVDSNVNGAATPVFKYGPYLLRVPHNPLNDQNTVQVLANGTPMPAPAALPVMNGPDPYGWIYKPQTQEWMANLAGSDSSGTPYANY